MSVRTEFSDSFPYQDFGRITGTFAVTRFPSVPGYLCRFKVSSGNGGNIYIGTAKNTGSFPMPYPLEPGDDTGWFSMALDDTVDGQGNLNVFYMNGSSGTCYVSYWIQR